MLYADFCVFLRITLGVNFNNLKFLYIKRQTVWIVLSIDASMEKKETFIHRSTQKDIRQCAFVVVFVFFLIFFFQWFFNAYVFTIERYVLDRELFGLVSVWRLLPSALQFLLVFP